MIVKNFKAMASLHQKDSGAYYVEYTLFSQGKHLTQDHVVCTSIPTYGTDNSLPGLLIEVYLNESNGNPFSYGNTFDLPTDTVISIETPFIELSFYVNDVPRKFKGGVIIRGSVPD